MLPIISSDELRKIRNAIENKKQETEASLDLGITKTKIRLGSSCFYFGESAIEIPGIRDDDKSCYVVSGRELQKVQFFSNGKLYKLVPTSNRPILQISGTSMHKKEFVERIEKDRLTGKVLDSGTGLGYTAVAAAKTAAQVITVEMDRTVIDIARLNPYSKDLFEKSNIKQVSGDIVDEIKKFSDSEFDFAVFDAGTPHSSSSFFSLANYREAYRVLKKKGRIYHYLPRAHISRGRDFGAEAISRIKKAGFARIKRNMLGSYAVAEKS